jgi:hypothetical protein
MIREEVHPLEGKPATGNHLFIEHRRGELLQSAMPGDTSDAPAALSAGARMGHTSNRATFTPHVAIGFNMSS